MNELTTLFGVDYVEGSNSLLISRQDYEKYAAYISMYIHAKELYINYVYISFINADVALEVANYLRASNQQSQ